MMTRRGLARQEESKLQQVLLELKTTKEQVVQLNNEREENETELISVIERNGKLKQELSLMNTRLDEARFERDSLQIMLNNYDRCSVEYEQALQQISKLEHELRDAHRQITHLEEELLNVNTKQNISLFDELLERSPQLVIDSKPKCTDIIDLTKDTPQRHIVSDMVHLSNCSNNKLKKYIKINKFIRKNQNLIKNCRSINKNIKNCKHRMESVKELSLYTLELENSQKQHEAETQLLNTKLQKLQDSLNSVTSMYDKSQLMIREYSLAMDKLIESTSHYADRFASLEDKTNYNCNRCTLPLSLNSPEVSNLCISNHLCDSFDTIGCDVLSQTYIFSDEIGRDMGSKLSFYMKGQSFINYCTPSASYCDIMKQVSNHNFVKDDNLVILIGDRGSVTKQELIKYCESLSNLNVNKIVLYTLPYCNNLPDAENKIRYNLNLTLHTIACYNDKINIIDINSIFKNNYYLTKGKHRLSNYYKRQVASSLHYCIDISAKNLATQTALFEQSNNSMSESSQDSLYPNNLN